MKLIDSSANNPSKPIKLAFLGTAINWLVMILYASASQIPELDTEPALLQQQHFTFKESDSQLTIPMIIKKQVDNVKKRVLDLKNSNQEAYLVLGSANCEIDFLLNKAKKDNWVFWNLSTHEGQTSQEDGNPFIDASFNDKALLSYVAIKLKDSFARIVVPEQVIEYTQWKIPEFLLWKEMLAHGGKFTFALNWLGENALFASFRKATKEISYDLIQETVIEHMNHFDLSYENRETYMANQYNWDINRVFGFLSYVGYPTFDAEDVTLDLQHIALPVNDENKEKIQSYTKMYIDLINDPQYKNDSFETHALNIGNLESVRTDQNLSIIMSFHACSQTPFFTEQEALDYFTRALTLAPFNKKSYETFQTCKSKWLERELTKFFSKVTIQDIAPNDSENDIPSQYFKLGRTVINLIK